MRARGSGNLDRRPLRSETVLRRLRRSRAARRDNPPARARGGHARRPHRRHDRPERDGQGRRRCLRAPRTVARRAAHPLPGASTDICDGSPSTSPPPPPTPYAHDHRELRSTIALEPARTTGDALLVERLVANPIDNAVRHNTPKGWLDVATYTAAGRAAFTIANTGPVIPTGELTRLFQPFQQRSCHERSSADGVGVGLAIVQAIANAHDATVTAHARTGGGLRIEIGFPAAPSETARRVALIQRCQGRDA